MSFIIFKQNAGDLVINTNQIATITQTRLTAPLTYEVKMSNGENPIILDAKQYAALNSEVKAYNLPLDPGDVGKLPMGRAAQIMQRNGDV